MWKLVGAAAVTAIAGVASARQEPAPAPQPVEVPEETGDVTIEDPGSDVLIEEQRGTMSPEEITMAQVKLKEQGYFAGTVSGTMDEDTVNALRKFQRAQGIAETGRLDGPTARLLGIEVETAPQSGLEGGRDADAEVEESTSPVTGGGTARSETGSISGETQAGPPAMGGERSREEIEAQAGVAYDADTIRAVQRVLARRGMFDGQPTGAMDTATVEALRRFQRENGLTVSGDLDLATLQALGVRNVPANPQPKATPPTSGPY